MSLNKVMLIGNTGKDPDVRHLESGVATASFTLATTERYRDRNGEYRDQTEWHNIVCWRNLADIVEKYVRKGTQLYIEGKIRSRQYTDREGNPRYITEIVADSLQLLGRKADNPASSGYSAPAASGSGYSAHPAEARPQTQPVSSTPAAEEDPGDDLPF